MRLTILKKQPISLKIHLVSIDGNKFMCPIELYRTVRCVSASFDKFMCPSEPIIPDRYLTEKADEGWEITMVDGLIETHHSPLIRPDASPQYCKSLRIKLLSGFIRSGLDNSMSGRSDSSWPIGQWRQFSQFGRTLNACNVHVDISPLKKP